MRTAAALSAALLMLVPAKAQEWGKLYPSIAVASEYRYDGVSNSSGNPALQASLYWWRPDHFFAGVFATTVDFGGFHDPDTSCEIDIYAGYNWDFGPPYFEMEGDATRVALQVMYTLFPDQGPRGPTYDFLQLTARAEHRVRKLTLRAEASYVPEASFGAGRAIKLEGGAELRLASWARLSSEVGYRESEKGADRTYWDIGATVDYRRASLDIRYHDTDLDFVTCGFSTNCASSIVVTATWRFWGN